VTGGRSRRRAVLDRGLQRVLLVDSGMMVGVMQGLFADAGGSGDAG
jgi:hypothetical protein